MRRNRPLHLALVMAFALVIAPAWAGKNAQTIQGYVIKVEQQVSTQNDGQFDQLRIRTRQGEEMQLKLGQAGSCQGCVQVGDRIRAQVMMGGNGEAQIQSMQVRRNREMYGYHLEAGTLVRTRSQLRDGSGLGQQSGRRGANGGSDSRGQGGRGSGGSGFGGGGPGSGNGTP